MDDLLREFVTETNESLDVVDVELVRFEQDPNNAKILDNIFRLVHTIKGTCGFLGLPRLETLAHAAETLMGKFRDGLPATNEAVTVILATIDRIKDNSGIAGARPARAGRRRQRSDRRSGAHRRADRLGATPLPPHAPTRRRRNASCGRAKCRLRNSNACSAKRRSIRLPSSRPSRRSTGQGQPPQDAAGDEPATTTTPRAASSRSGCRSIRSNN